MAANGEPIPRRDPDVEGRDVDNEEATENTPLLPSNESENADQSQPHREQSAESLLRTFTTNTSSSGKGGILRRRWPSILALLILCLVAILIMIFAFFAPSVVEQYAQQAVVFEPTSLSIDSFTSTGVKARIQGDFTMDASRVKKKPVRDLGRFATWIASKAESGQSEVEVSLPEYGNVVLGTAKIPGIVVDIRNGHRTHVDFLSDLEPGNKDGIRRIANDWIDGRLGQLRILGKATVPVKSGLFSFGTQKISHEVLFAHDEVPTIPGYEIKRLSVHETNGKKAVAADVSLSVENQYPVDFSVPSLGFRILVGGCADTDPYIPVADAMTHETHIQPKSDVEVNATGVVRQLPKILIRDCPGSDQSPLDTMLRKYMRGKENTVYVQGSTSPDEGTPDWISDLISDIVVPVPLPGKKMGHLIRNFSLADTHFNLPDPFAKPGSPEENPRISAKVRALVAIPEEMNFSLSANRVRAEAEIFYKGSKLGNLDLHKWQPANSTRVEGDSEDEGPSMLVESLVDKAPLEITDEDVFADVIQELVFGRKSVTMHVQAEVDVQVETALGEFKVRRIPAEGTVPVKPISGGHGNDGKNGTSFGSFMPKIAELRIIDTTATSLTLDALVNLTNPTKYSASIPYVDIHIVKNGSLLGHGTARNLHIIPGNNDLLHVQAVYCPLDLGGWNTTISLQTHEGTIPNQPALGKALSRFALEIPTPRLRPPIPKDPDDPGKPNPPPEDDGPHFIKDAVMHLFTSTATFTLLSPLKHSTIFIESINATALYKGDDVGHILYDLPFAVPPVDQDGKGITTPRLPVDWSLGSVGYEAVKNALGGTLKLSAFADVGVRLDKFRETVWFHGKGIGARVRL